MSKMDEQQIREIAEVVAEEVTKDLFEKMGVNVEDFDDIRHFRSDLIWVRRYRQVSEKVGSRVLVTLTSMATVGIVAAVFAYMGWGPKN